MSRITSEAVAGRILHDQAWDDLGRGSSRGSRCRCVCAAEQPAAMPTCPRCWASTCVMPPLNQCLGLKAAFEEWKAALEQIPQAKALPDPKFTYDYFVRQIDDRQRVGIMQTFPWFGKIAARTDAAAAAAQAAQSRYEARRVQLFSEVKQAFYEFAYLAGATRVARENLALIQHLRKWHERSNHGGGNPSGHHPRANRGGAAAERAHHL